MMNPAAESTGKETDRERCPQLKTTLMYCCTAPEQAFVLLPFMVEAFCKKGEFRECPFRKYSLVGSDT